MSASWVKCELLARGKAEVYLAVDKETGKLFVVKTCDCDDKRTTSELLNEITIFLVLDTPRVVQYLGSSFTDEDGKRRLDLFLEYMPGGSLRKHIGKLGGRLQETLIKTYTTALLVALHHLHTKGIVHGDVKADNILVGLDGIKLSDFGASKFLHHDPHRAMRGTPAWMAPEVVAKLDQGFPSDIWSLGCTVLEMATGQDPWGKVSSKTDLKAIQLSHRIPDVSSLSPQGQKFVKRCLVRNPKDRWTAAQLLEEEFIRWGAVDLNSASSSPALERIRATFPDSPGKIITIKQGARKQKPTRTPPKTSENIRAFRELALPTSGSQVHKEGKASYTQNGTSPEGQENAGSTESSHQSGLTTVPKLKSRKGNTTNVRTQQTNAGSSARDIDSAEKLREPQTFRVEPGPSHLWDEETNLNNTRKYSKRDMTTPAPRPSQSSTTKETITPNDPNIHAIGCKLPDHYPDHTEPRRQHESWEAETTHGEEAMTSYEQLQNQHSETNHSPSHRCIPPTKALHHDEWNHRLYEDADVLLVLNQSSAWILGEMRKAGEHDGLRIRHETGDVSVLDPGTPASDNLSDCSDPPTSPPGGDSFNTDTWETDKEKIETANPHSRPACENNYRRYTSPVDTPTYVTYEGNNTDFPASS
ncbi:hypothetical protein R1sor_010411 [Riccia sorocarpa]|uniref:Protein kinase domain-containing protein n=1 Tax=Riccia sorocarpa TaxID=122646 RepID=A0ABD3I1W0_9MARC